MNNTITLTELLKQLQEKLSDSIDSEKFIEAFVSTIVEGLTKDNEVIIKGLGKFFIVKSDSTNGDAKSNILFIPDNELAETVNQPFAFFDAVELDDDVTDNLLNEQEETASETETPVIEPEQDNTITETNEGVTIPETVLNTESQDEEVSDDSNDTATDSDSDKFTDESELEDIIEDTNSDYTYDGNSDEATATEIIVTEPEENETEPTDVSEKETSDENEDETTTDDNVTEENVNNEYNDYSETVNSDKSWLWLLLFFILGLAIGWCIPTFITHRSSDEEIILHDTIYIEKTVIAKDTVKAEAKPVEPTKVVTDTVKPNRFLTTIARQYYGNAEFWAYIYIENGEKKLGNPNTIRPGTVVVVPPAEKYGIDAKSRQSIDLATKKCQEILDKYGSK